MFSLIINHIEVDLSSLGTMCQKGWRDPKVQERFQSLAALLGLSTRETLETFRKALRPFGARCHLVVVFWSLEGLKKKGDKDTAILCYIDLYCIAYPAYLFTRVQYL